MASALDEFFDNDIPKKTWCELRVVNDRGEMLTLFGPQIPVSSVKPAAPHVIHGWRIIALYYALGEQDEVRDRNDAYPYTREHHADTEALRTTSGAPANTPGFP